MSKKKLNQKSSLPSRMELYRAFLKRLKAVSDLMFGKGFFEEIPKEHLGQLFENRYAPLKLEFAAGLLEKQVQVDWQEDFKLKLDQFSIRVIEGNGLSLADFFRDGVLLVNYARFMAEQHSTPIMKTICEVYSGQSPLFIKALKQVVGFVNTICVVHSDIIKDSFVYDLSSTSILSASKGDNKIRIGRQKPSAMRLNRKGVFREFTSLCWSDMVGKLAPVTVSPAKLGFGKEFVGEVSVWFQHHAAMRLTQRLGIHNGATLYLLEEVFRDKHNELRLELGKLLPFSINRKKLGYLVTELMDDKLVIITFLFLTNDGTPEGKRLAELTRLQKMDKQYVGIDTLSGFRSLNVPSDPTLSKLFMEAGCGHLLNLSDIGPILDPDVGSKDPQMLIRYLQGSPFMNRNDA